MRRRILIVALAVCAAILALVLALGVGADAVSVTPQTVVDEGITPTYHVLTSTGVMFANNGKVILHVNNAYTGTVTITVLTPVTVGGLVLADQTITVATGATKFIGPFDINYYNSRTGTSRGKTTVTSSSDLSVTVAVLKY